MSVIGNPIIIGAAPSASIAQEDDVIFIDYDGTIVKSYSSTDFASLTQLPKNPTHEGLISRGWNWTLTDAKAYVSAGHKLVIGQSYDTDDGSTRIYIKLEDGRLSPFISFSVTANMGVSILWGDGESQTINASSGETVTIQHNYLSAGEYIIKIARTTAPQSNGYIQFYGDATEKSSRILSNNSSSSNEAYRNAIQKIEVGANVDLLSYCFAGCHSLATIVLPSNFSHYNISGMFRNCYSLTAIVTTSSGINIRDGYFYNCYNLKYFSTHLVGLISYEYDTFYCCRKLRRVNMCSTYLSIYDSCFRGCESMAYFLLPSNANLPINGGYSDILRDCKSLKTLAIQDGSTTAIPARFCTDCDSLTTVTIPDGVTGIGISAFEGCVSLSSVTIPQSLTFIWRNAFLNCSSLGYIKFESSTPPTIENLNAFSGIPTDCKIYVPSGSLSTYTSTTNYPSSSVYTYVEY